MKRKLVLLVLLGYVFSTCAVADPPEGRGWRKHQERYQAKWEFQEGNCRVKREWKRNGDYVEVRKCKGSDHALAQHFGQVGTVPPWVGQSQKRTDKRGSPSTSTRCISETVGSVLGGILGSAAGNQVGDGRGKTVATIGGTIAGVLIGGDIGKRMDLPNQACIAQALEFAPEGERIVWENGPRGTEQYAVTAGPVARQGEKYCRSFLAEVLGDEGSAALGNACRGSDGDWVRSL